MISISEEALKCDMAETYHIYITDWYNPPFPLSFIADLACGLGDSSRIKRKIANVKLTLSETLQAVMIDKLSILIWQRTKDGTKGRNLPDSVYRKLEGLDDRKKEDLRSFSSEEEYLEWYNSKMR
jgi:hypothetical protein